MTLMQVSVAIAIPGWDRNPIVVMYPHPRPDSLGSDRDRHNFGQKS
jgi:hypothetical protein